MFLDKTIRLFLDSIGRREEYEFYLSKFRAMDTPAFGLLCPNLPAVEQAAAILDFDLRFLLRLELHPVVLLAGADADAMRKLLVADEDLWHVEKLDKGNDETVSQRCGDAVGLAAKAGKIPLLLSGCSPSESLRVLLPAVARRVHFVRARGPLHDTEGRPLPFYYTARGNDAELASEDRAVFEEVRLLLEERPGLHFSFTSPHHLLEEFFTVVGSGTVLRRGSVIRYTARAEDVDAERLNGLLSESFRGRLNDLAWLDAIHHFHIEENYRAAALLEEHRPGAYLSKFAVGTEARGEGLAQELWNEVTARHKALFWRSRTANPVNQWYEKKANGRFSAGGWNVYWRGLRVEDVPGIVTFCMNRPPDFSYDPVNP